MSFDLLKESINKGRNIFLSGPAGTGKTYFINKLCEELMDKKNIARTATTGIAALNMNGETIHRFSAIGIESDKKAIKFIRNKYSYKKEIKYIIQETDLLIIDEISMLSHDQFELIDLVFKDALDSERPYGGMQVIFSGDFMQLSPVVVGRMPEKLYCFESEIWNELKLKNIYLTEVKRQDNEYFCKMLRYLRAGVITQEVNDFFLSCNGEEIPEDIKPVFIVSTNAEVDTINKKEIDLIESEVIYNRATITAKNQKLKDKIIKDCKAPIELELKPGCQVMTLTNDLSGDFVNGSMGKFIRMDTKRIPIKSYRDTMFIDMDALVIETPNGNEIKVIKHEFKTEKTRIDDYGEIYKETLASFIQYPVNIAYGITGHKSQGSTIDYIVADMKRIFTFHQAYVILSRAKTKEGLKILNWDPLKIFVDQRCFNFYKKIYDERDSEDENN